VTAFRPPARGKVLRQATGRACRGPGRRRRRRDAGPRPEL